VHDAPDARADLTDNFNNMLLSGFKCSLKTYSYKAFIRDDLVTNGVCTCEAAIRFFKLHD